MQNPLLHYVRRMTDTSGRWEKVGDYAVWAGHRGKAEPPYGLLEMTGAGIVPVRKDASATPLLHRIEAGTPHHITHLFGFWHVSDSDLVWLQAVYSEATYYMMTIGGITGRPSRDACRWYCPRCGNQLHQADFDTATLGFGGFLAFQLEGVREFNRDRKLRTCERCSFVHPLAYGFHAEEDTAPEREARQEW